VESLLLYIESKRPSRRKNISSLSKKKGVRRIVPISQERKRAMGGCGKVNFTGKKEKNAE